MSTHRKKCVVCEEWAYCCNDSHALGCTDGSSCSGDTPTIEFCSEECFKELEKRMADRWKIYLEVTGRKM